MNKLKPSTLLLAGSKHELVERVDSVLVPYYTTARVQTITATVNTIEMQEIIAVLAFHEFEDGTIVDLLNTENLNVPVIFLTATGDISAIQKVLDMGAESYLICDRQDDELVLLPNIIEQVLRRAESSNLLEVPNYKAILSSSSDMVVMYDTEYRYILTNPKHLEMWDQREEDVIGKHLSEILGDNFFSTRAKPNLDKCLEGNSVRYQTWFEFPLHGKRYLDVYSYPAYDDANNIVGVVTTMRDLTDQNKMEDILRLHSEALYHAAEGVHIVSIPDAQFLYVNPTFERMFGYDEGELLGQHVSILNAPANMTDTEAAFQSIMEALKLNNYWEGEIQNVRKDGSVFWCHAKITSFEHSEYGSVWLTIQEDIDKRKRIEQELVFHSEALQKTTDGVYCVRVEDNTIIYSNEHFDRMFGYERGELLGKPVSIINDPDENDPDATVQEIVAHLIRNKQWRGEVKNIAKDGSKFWCQVEVVEFDHYEFGKVWLSVQKNINEKKQASLEIDFHSRSLEALSEAVYCVSVEDGLIVYANEATYQMYGYDKGEMIGSHITIFNAEQTLSRAQSVMDHLPQHKSWSGTVDNIRKDGSVFWSRVQMEELEHPAYGKVWLTVQTDITEEKLANESLIASEARFRAVVANSRDIITIIGSDGKVKYESPAIEAIIGYTPEEMIGRSFIDMMNPDQPQPLISGVVHEEDHALVMEHLLTLLQTSGYREPIELRIQHKNGSWRILEATATNLLDDPAINGILITSRDITERKHATMALEHSEENLARAQKIAHVGNWNWDIISGDITWSDEVFRIFGYVPQQFHPTYEAFLKMVHPEDREHVQQVVQRAVEGSKSYSLDHRILLESGEIRTVHEEGEVTFSESGQPVFMLGIVQDITERIERERQLEELNTTLEERVEKRTAQLEEIINQNNAILNSSGDGILLLDLEFTILSANPATDLLLDMPTSDYLNRSLLDYIWREDIAELMITCESVKKQKQKQQMELHVKHGNSTFEVEINLSPVYDAAGDLTSFVGILRDISTRKVTENALRDSERRFRIIAENYPSYFSIIERDFTVGYTSGYEFKKAGLNSNDYIGLSVQDVFGDKFETIKAYYDKVFAGEEETFELFLNGQYQRYRAVPLPEDDGSISQILAVVENISEQKEAELAVATERNLLRTLIDSLPDYIYMKDTEHRFVLSNIAHAQARGFSDANEIIGKTDFAFFPEELAQQFKDEEIQVLRNNIPLLDHEQPSKTESGGFEWALSNKVPLHDENGNIIGLVGFTRDITYLKNIESFLRESQNMLQLVLDTIPVRVFWKDVNSVYLGANKLFLQDAGLDNIEDLVGNVDTILFPHEAELYNADDRTVILSGEARLNYEERQTTPDGNILWLQTSKIPLCNTENQIIGVLGTYVDITERKLAQDALRESEKRYRLLAENVTDMISRHTPEGEYTYATPSALDITGYAPEELVGHSAYQYFHPEDIASIQESHSTILEIPDTTTVVYRFRQKSGDYAWVETTSHTIRDEHGITIEIIAVTRDISQRRMMEEERNQLAQRLELATQAASIGIWDGTLDGEEMYWDNQQLNLYGITQEEFTNSNQMFDHLVHPDDREYVNQQLQDAIKTASKYRSEFRILRPDGQLRHILAYADIVTNGSEQGRIVGVNLDITEIKDAEITLREALQRERELSALKSRFVSMASHELRTPLASILSIAETLRVYRERMTNDQIDQRFASIKDQVLYLRGIMEDVLQLERIQSGHIKFEPKDNDLSALLTDIICDFEEQLGFSDRIIFELSIETKIIRYDQHLIRQVLTNLISNALKYSPDGKPVEIMLAEASTELFLSIRDYGIGIPQDDLNNLFEPFHRASNVGTIRGTGLGLSIAKRAIEAHGGRIEVESKIDSGTTFTITLPITQGE